MKTFILLTKLSPEITKQMRDRAKIGRSWLEQVKEKCPEVKFISHYSIAMYPACGIVFYVKIFYVFAIFHFSFYIFNCGLPRYV